jgi:adenylate cyclase
MNLFFKSYRIYLIFFLLITCESGMKWGFAQQSDLHLTPWIQEINLPPQYSEIPNETFYRDRQGTLFIGKNSGLSIINGRQIFHFHMDGPVYVTGDGSDTLYYVSGNDLGFLVREKGPTFRTISRKHLLPASLRIFTPSGIQHKLDSVFIYTDIGRFLLSRTKIEFIDPQTGDIEQCPVDTSFNRKVIQKVGEKIGIPADGIRQIFVWNKSEIWILGAYTLYRINDPSPLNLLETGSVNTGRILKSMVSDGQILLGTSRGIFSVSETNENTGQWSITNLLPESSHSIHMFSAVNNQVFAAGSKGLFLIVDQHAEMIDKGSFTGIQAIRKGCLIASGEHGTGRYNLNKSVWKYTSIDPTLRNAHSFANYNNETYFLCNNSIFKINSRGDRITPVSFNSEDQLYRIIRVEQDLLLLSNRQVFQYDRNEHSFQPLPANHHSELINESDMILPGSDEHFWILQNSGDYLSKVLYTNNLDESSATYSAFPVLQNLGEVIDMAFADSILYLTGKDKISIFDLRSLQNDPGEITIHLQDPELADDQQRFHFSGLELQHLPEPLFRYRLLPGNTSWSGWSSSRDYEVSGLRQGKYSIEVQAMDLYGRKSEATRYSFIIAPPFYAKWYAYIFYVILFLAGLFLLQKWRMQSYHRAESRISERMERKIASLAEEKEKSERLLADILPEETANQIRNQGKAKWDKYERATVLFSDIQGFTKIAEEMNPEMLIDELDTFFFHFDSVVEKYNIEKIKTIGDAYMAAGGIPQINSTNPVEVVMAALEMQSYMQQLKSSRAEIWDLRIGIHSGPVIAGVVGHKKMSYDIWGDTVNTASRMESSGTAGKINISGITYGLVKEYFLCEYRGKLPVKYKGNIEMYYVIGLRPELSVDLKGIPNKRFFLKLQLLRLGDLEVKIFDDILTKLPESLHFHSLNYARKVYNQSMLLCRSEEIEQEDTLLVKTAALMLFTGLTQEYQNFENRSLVICREILPDFNYSDKQIDQICNLILSTKKPVHPMNRLEKILIDSRMEFIGRPDYTHLIKKLFQELKEAGSKINGQQFKKQQLELLFDFQYYTVAANRLREVSGTDQMSNLEQERWI